jgi:hypothetical protein
MSIEACRFREWWGSKLSQPDIPSDEAVHFSYIKKGSSSSSLARINMTGTSFSIALILPTSERDAVT